MNVKQNGLNPILNPTKSGVGLRHNHAILKISVFLPSAVHSTPPGKENQGRSVGRRKERRTGGIGDHWWRGAHVQLVN